ncbi:hypothetical protein LX36DRAFT_192726 [Colletotrichum falcatum]|nr:hypothetical protein LX36DRAFT_192726 [Colletotrichum falcatum]
MLGQTAPRESTAVRLDVALKGIDFTLCHPMPPLSLWPAPRSLAWAGQPWSWSIAFSTTHWAACLEPFYQCLIPFRERDAPYDTQADATLQSNLSQNGLQLTRVHCHGPQPWVHLPTTCVIFPRVRQQNETCVRRRRHRLVLLLCFSAPD